MSCNNAACECCEKLTRLLEFFYTVRGACVTHVMTGDFFVAYGRSKPTGTDKISFTADSPDEAIEGALQQWEAAVAALPPIKPNAGGGPITRLDPPASDQHLDGSNDSGQG